MRRSATFSSSSSIALARAVLLGQLQGALANAMDAPPPAAAAASNMNAKRLPKVTSLLRSGIGAPAYPLCRSAASATGSLAALRPILTHSS
jgi:hypothetical protein